MTLIIAEKPSLGRNIAAAVGNMSRRDGYLEGNGYIITWAFGHLFSLCDIEDYTGAEKGARWSMEGLPCIPEKFKFTLRRGADRQVDAGVEKQFGIIKNLCERSDVDAIVNAGDADREGEIIVRLCVEHTGVTGKKFLRLWLPDQTPQTVLRALSEMKDESEYSHLAAEGFARTYIDWLYGVNLTRYATLKCGTLLRVGRVIVPIVKAIYDRDMAIKNFTPEKYFAPQSRAETGGEEIELTSKERFSAADRQKAEELCKKYNETGAVVTSVKTKKDEISAGKLYSLTKLQNMLGKKYKMPMDESLAIAQKLYEEGYLTYPRTNSEYLATAEQDKIKQILENIKKVGYPVEFKFKKSIFDDSKIEAHSALTPTYKIPGKDALSPAEMQVYKAVFRRFVAVFCAEECKAEKSEIKISVGDLEEFVLKGTVITERGWTKYDDYDKKDKILPLLHKGDAVNINFVPAEKETTPPKHYTIETLNNYLKNPFKEEKAAAKEKADEDESDDDEYKAIFEGLELGTEATRTGIIDNARRSKYIELKKDVYYIMPDGIYLIDSLARMKISMDKHKTSTLGRALKQIYHGKISVSDGVEIARNEICEVFENKSLPPEDDYDSGFFGDVIGKCPLCSRDVVRYKYSYGCSGYKDGCKFSIPLALCSRVISKVNAVALLERGKSAKINNFISKSGKPFSATLVLSDGRVNFDFG